MNGQSKPGFMLLESMVSCLIIMVTWYLIVQCAVQAIVLQHRIEQKRDSFIVASTIIEKLRSGLYELKDQNFKENGFEIMVTCSEKLFSDSLYHISLKIMLDTQEILCIKTALLKHS